MLVTSVAPPPAGLICICKSPTSPVLLDVTVRFHCREVPRFSHVLRAAPVIEPEPEYVETIEIDDEYYEALNLDWAKDNTGDS